MVGKLSDDTKMSGSRIPVLYCWQNGIAHPYKTPNEELANSIAALDGELKHSDIGEPGIVGNLLEPTLAENACQELGLPHPLLTPDVIRLESFEVSCDAISDVESPVMVRASDLVSILELNADDLENPSRHESIELLGPVPIEIKCTSDYRSDAPPLYRGPIQLQMQMMAVGADAGVLVSLHRGIERQIVIYRRNEAICQEIERICDDFMRRVIERDYYPPVSVDDAIRAAMSEEKTETDISHLDEDIERLERLRADRAQFDETIEQIETKIMDAIGDAHVGNSTRYRVEWPVRHYKAQPEKLTPAKDAKTIRLRSLKIKSIV